MVRIGVRELRQHASRYLDVVRSGGTVEVTDRGRLIALLVPPGPASEARDRLIRAGRLEPASAPFRLPTPVRVAPGAGSAALEGLRAERLQ